MTIALIVFLAGWLAAIVLVYHGGRRTWRTPSAARDIRPLVRQLEHPIAPLAVALTAAVLWPYLVVAVPRSILADRRWQPCGCVWCNPQPPTGTETR